MKRRIGLWHPSKQRLRAWLLTGDPGGVGAHVEQCERCAERLEALDESEPVFALDSPSPLRQALTSLLAPPDGLNDRVVEQVTLRTRPDGELALLAGLFAIGVETAQLMFDPGDDQHRADGPGDARPDENDQEEPT